MRHHTWLALAGLASVLACSKAANVLLPESGGIDLVRDEQSFLRIGEPTTIDFENLPWNGSSCSTPLDPPGNALDNPLELKGVVFRDPYCIRSGYCSSPTCPEANVTLALSQGATIAFPAHTRGVQLQIEGMGGVPFILEVEDRAGRTVSAEGTGVLYGTLVLGFRSAPGIREIRVTKVGPTPPDCPEAPCGPLVLSRLSFVSP